MRHEGKACRHAMHTLQVPAAEGKRQKHVRVSVGRHRRLSVGMLAQAAEGRQRPVLSCPVWRREREIINPGCRPCRPRLFVQPCPAANKCKHMSISREDPGRVYSVGRGMLWRMTANQLGRCFTYETVCPVLCQACHVSTCMFRERMQEGRVYNVTTNEYIW